MAQLGGSRFVHFCTVNGQSRRIARCSSCVRGCTSVFPGVPGAHRLDGHQTDPFRGARYRDIPVILAGYRLPVQSPGHFDRQVALDDRADCRDRFSPIRGLVADRERRDLRRD